MIINANSDGWAQALKVELELSQSLDGTLILTLYKAALPFSRLHAVEPGREHLQLSNHPNNLGGVHNLPISI